MTFKEWFVEIQWLKDKVILPNQKRIDKFDFMINGKIDADKLNKKLKEEYDRAERLKNTKPDGRRYKK